MNSFEGAQPNFSSLRLIHSRYILKETECSNFHFSLGMHYGINYKPFRIRLIRCLDDPPILNPILLSPLPFVKCRKTSSWKSNLQILKFSVLNSKYPLPLCYQNTAMFCNFVMQFCNVLQKILPSYGTW